MQEVLWGQFTAALDAAVFAPWGTGSLQWSGEGLLGALSGGTPSCEWDVHVILVGK